MVAAVGAMPRFYLLIAALNGLLGWTAGLIGYDGVTIQSLLGWLLQPLAFLLGVPWNEAAIAGSLIGQKLVLNEFVAYVDFLARVDDMQPITQAIVTFALCGFANFSSIAILLGGLGALAPTRRHDISIVPWALPVATLAIDERRLLDSFYPWQLKLNGPYDSCHIYAYRMCGYIYRFVALDLLPSLIIH